MARNLGAPVEVDPVAELGEVKLFAQRERC
jgi:hypothetical protein